MSGLGSRLRRLCIATHSCMHVVRPYLQTPCVTGMFSVTQPSRRVHHHCMTGHGMGVPVFWSQDRCALVMPLQKARGSSGKKMAGMVSGGMNHYSKPQLL